MGHVKNKRPLPYRRQLPAPPRITRNSQRVGSFRRKLLDRPANLSPLRRWRTIIIVSNNSAENVKWTPASRMRFHPPSPRTTTSPKPPNPPPLPIHTVNSSIKDIVSVVSTLDVPKTAFQIKESDPSNHTIYLNVNEHHTLVCEKLRALGVQHFTYTPSHLKLKSLLLKGIRGDFSEDIIKQEIVDLNLPNVNVSNLSRFTYNKNHPDKFHHLVQLLSDSKTSDLHRVKSIAYQKVRWEHLKKTALFQCKNC